MIAIEIDVVLMLRSSASSATGEAIARHEFSLAVHSKRLRNGRLIKPASSASAATASPEASVSPRPGRLGILLSLTRPLDRKSTRLNSTHANISYADFCLKKKNTIHSNISDL